ncbi:hypothetical protein LCGC14_1955050 [marine sediment metagenome]|uniref:NAD-dependent epimerase/dehydratase domain-containing protein n=1 Tax=marine sediment metagenome TaxID=412755 RepID=A0A0F9HUN2_9ZZZZ
MVGIIGATGFIGSALTEQLQGISITRENYNQHRGSHFDILINANGNSKKYLADKDPLQEFTASVGSLSQFVRDFSYNLFVLISSCDVYEQMIPEMSREEISINPTYVSQYGYHKLIAEQIIHGFCPSFLIIRLGGCVGKNMWKNPIYDIITRKQLFIHPASSLQYLHVDKMAEIVSNLCKDSHRGTFNVCGKRTEVLQDMLNIDDVKWNEELPKIVYDINIDKISCLYEIPTTYKTITDFAKQRGKL